VVAGTVGCRKDRVRQTLEEQEVEEEIVISSYSTTDSFRLGVGLGLGESLREPQRSRRERERELC
jgi:hypothetical protein